MGRNKADVTKAMLTEQAEALNEPLVDGEPVTRNAGEEDFDRLYKGGEGESLATAMARGAGEPLPLDGELTGVAGTEIDLDAPILEPAAEGECIHCFVGEPVEGMPDYFWPVAGDTHEAGVRHCPDGQGRFWFDKVLVNIAGKSQAVYKYDRVNSEKAGS